MLTPGLALALAATSFAQIYPLPSQSTNATNATAPAATTQSDISGLFLFNGTSPLEGFTSSLLCADSSDTTFVLGCATTLPAGNTICATDRQIEVTVTARPTNFDLAYSTFRNGGSGYVTQSCDFGGPSDSATQAVCTEGAYIAARGRTVTLLAIQSTIEISSAAPTFSFPMTANAVQTGACPATPTTSSTRSVATVPQGTAGASSNPAAGRVVKEVYKVLIPAGAAALAYAM